MKNFKKLAIVLMVLMLAASLVVGAVACAKTVGDKGTVTVVVESGKEGVAATEYVVDLSKLSGNKGLVTVLDYLKENESLTYAISGGMLTEVNNLKNASDWNPYISLWTSVEADKAPAEDEYATNKEYKKYALRSSNLGALSMTIDDGAVIYIGYAYMS